MNPQRKEDLQRRLEKLEAEMNSSSKVVTESEESGFFNFKTQIGKFASWFNGLAGTKKIVVGGVTVVLGFAILQAVLKLVTSVITLALLAVLVYVGYKIFVANGFHRKQ